MLQLQKISIPPMEGQWKFQGGGGWQKQNYGVKLEFLEGWGVDIFKELFLR